MGGRETVLISGQLRVFASQEREREREREGKRSKVFEEVDTAF